MFKGVPGRESESAKAFQGEYNVRGAISAKGVFDWMTYHYYLSLCDGWSVVDLTPTTGEKRFSLGESHGGSLDAVRRSQPHWATRVAWATEREKFTDAGADVVLAFHQDRN